MSGGDWRIARDTLDHPAVLAMLESHQRDLFAITPAGSAHALDLSGLRDPAVTVWTVWDGDVPVAAGALKALSATHGEIKAMRTVASHLRRGIGRAMLDHLIAEARARGYTRLSLETGSFAAFAPARALYRKAGFVDCPPFGTYRADPNSSFLTLAL